MSITTDFISSLNDLSACLLSIKISVHWHQDLVKVFQFLIAHLLIVHAVYKHLQSDCFDFVRSLNFFGLFFKIESVNYFSEP